MAGRTRQRRRYRDGERLTRAGWLYVLIGMLMGAAALKHDAAVTLLLLGGMLGALGVSALIAGRTVRGVRVTREAPDRVWQGQTVHMSYFLANEHRWFSCMGLSIRDLPQPQLDMAGGYCAHLEPRSRFRSGARFVARTRGRVTLDGVELRTGFPFSLVTAWRRVIEPTDLVVWPARGVLKADLLRRGAAEISAATPSLLTGGQDEFFGLREFRQDDNPRLIHWRRSAGRTQPLIREMARPLPDVLMIVIDTLTTDAGGAAIRERLLRLAATLIDRAMTRGYQVALALAGDDGIRTLAPAAGRAAMRDLLDALAELGENTAHPLARTLAALRRDWLGQSQVVVLSPRAGAVGRNDTRALRAASGHLTVIAGADRLADVFEDDPGLAEIL